MTGFVAILLLAMIAVVVVLVVQHEAKKREQAAYEARLRAIELSDIDNMDGLSFEHYVARLLRHEGYADVEISKGSGDFGIDVFASKGGRRYAIQVKRASGTVSRRAVSDAVAGKDYYSCNAAMVVTNSYLSRKSREFASSVECDIVDRDILAEWIMRFQASGATQAKVPGSRTPATTTPTATMTGPKQTPPIQQAAQRKTSGVPSEVLQSIKAVAASDYPGDYSTQAYICEEQIEAYRKLSTFSPKDIPQDILSKIMEQAARDHPSDFSTQLYVLEDQVESYRKLRGYAPSGIPNEVLAKVKEQSESEYPYDFSMQFYIIEDQIKSYQTLGQLELN